MIENKTDGAENSTAYLQLQSPVHYQVKSLKCDRVADFTLSKDWRWVTGKALIQPTVAAKRPAVLYK